MYDTIVLYIVLVGVVAGLATLSYLLNNSYVAFFLLAICYGSLVVVMTIAIWKTSTPLIHKFVESLIFMATSFGALVLARTIVLSVWPDVVIGGVVYNRQPLFMAKLWFGLLHLIAPLIAAFVIGILSMGWYENHFGLPYVDLFPGTVSHHLQHPLQHIYSPQRHGKDRQNHLRG